MRYILQRMKRFCGFATGVVFFIGGILKLMDPVGAGLVIKEYLDFLHLGFMSVFLNDMHEEVMKKTPYP